MFINTEVATQQSKRDRALGSNVLGIGVDGVRLRIKNRISVDIEVLNYKSIDSISSQDSGNNYLPLISVGLKNLYSYIDKCNKALEPNSIKVVKEFKDIKVFLCEVFYQSGVQCLCVSKNGEILTVCYVGELKGWMHRIKVRDNKSESIAIRIKGRGIRCKFLVDKETGKIVSS